ncbi:unnamed protein product [Rotaria sp. Silwood2]|nr:unnamed protein product [Rotaria sp. Silwood2]
MNTTSSNISSALLAAPYQLNIWFGSFIWLAGNIGCIGNMLVFRSPAFRKQAYSIYLLAEAMSDFLYFNFGLIIRILQQGFQIPLTTNYNIICKLRQFISIWSNQVSFSLFSFAIIDRLLSTQRSNIYRQWSNRVTLAYKMCITCVVFWLLFIGHRLILYNVINGKCAPSLKLYAYIDNCMEVVFKAIYPPIVMIVLAYLLIRSVRNVIKRKISHSNNRPSVTIPCRSVLQQIDSRLTFMLILQSIIATLTFIPYAAERIYKNITEDWPKSALQNAQESIFVELTHLLSYTFFASSFYVSIISNCGFRRELKNFFRKSHHNNPRMRTNNIFYTSPTNNIQSTQKHRSS